MYLVIQLHIGIFSDVNTMVKGERNTCITRVELKDPQENLFMFLIIYRKSKFSNGFVNRSVQANSSYPVICQVWHNNSFTKMWHEIGILDNLRKSVSIFSLVQIQCWFLGGVPLNQRLDMLGMWIGRNSRLLRRILMFCTLKRSELWGNAFQTI